MRCVERQAPGPLKLAITLVTPVVGLCRRSEPRRSVCRTRPSGSWSKPIGSCRFGGEPIFVCWKFLSTVAPQSLYCGSLPPVAQVIAPFRCVVSVASYAASVLPSAV